MAVRTGTLVWLRDVAITATVVVVGFSALGAITGHAYVGLPLAASAGVSSAPQAAIVSPHGPQPDCAACHRAHVAPDPELLVAAEADSSICVQCHNSGGEEPMSAHSNMDFLGATEASFYVGCAECHDPHGDPDGTGNRAMIRSNINGLPIRFTASSGADSFDDGFDDASHDSLCVACHTTTSHNNAFSTELIGEGHNPVGTDCTSCHQHGNDPALRAGFMPTGPGVLPPTETPTAVLPMPTETPTAVPTSTPVPPDTPTAAPSDTPAPSPVPPTPTDTAVPPPDTPTPTLTPTETPTPGP